MTRRQFLGKTLLAAGAPVLAGLPGSGCGAGDDDVATPDAAAGADAPGSPPVDAPTPDPVDARTSAPADASSAAADATGSFDSSTASVDSSTASADAQHADAFVCVVTDASGPSDTHGHMIAIPTADIENPQDRSYTSTGGTHDHTFHITAAELAELAANCAVTVHSNDTHPHTWIIAMIG